MMAKRELTRIPLFAAITVVLAQFAFPLPFSPVPFTFGLLAVFIAGALQRPLAAAVSQIVYLGLGAVGLPVFAEFSGGLGILVGPRGGYLFSYPIVAFIIACFSSLYEKKRRNMHTVTQTLCVFASIVPAIGVCYLLGVLQLSFVANLSLDAAFKAGALPFIPFDLLKAALTAVLVVAVKDRIMSFSDNRHKR